MSVRTWQMEGIRVYSHLIQIWQKLFTITDETRLSVISMQVITQSMVSQQWWCL